MATGIARYKAAQAWCKPNTEHFAMQPELAEVFAEILDEILSQAWLGNASTAELLSELQTRAEIHGYANYKTVAGDTGKQIGE